MPLNRNAVIIMQDKQTVFLRINNLVLAPVVTASRTLLLLSQCRLVLSQLFLRGTVLLEHLGAVDGARNVLG